MIRDTQPTSRSFNQPLGGTSGADALAAIERDAPDLLFLDVQMPEMDGFELLQKLPRESLPIVIFITAYDKHAVRAFEAHALDYLLKPVQPERFKAAVARAPERPWKLRQEVRLPHRQRH